MTLTISAAPALAQTPAPARSALPSADLSRPVANRGAMTPEARIAVATAVKTQVQPCADRQIVPALEAGQIIAVVQLSLNRDGSLASFRIVSHEGVTESNRRYVARVDDAVEATFTGCTPLHGLPPELYDVPGGWRSMQFRYRLKA